MALVPALGGGGASLGGAPHGNMDWEGLVEPQTSRFIKIFISVLLILPPGRLRLFFLSFFKLKKKAIPISFISDLLARRALVAEGSRRCPAAFDRDAYVLAGPDGRSSCGWNPPGSGALAAARGRLLLSEVTNGGGETGIIRLQHRAASQSG